MIASEKPVPDGGTRNATFITVEWSLPGCVVIRELNGRVVQYIFDEEEEELVDEPLPEGTLVNVSNATVTVVHALSDLIVDSIVPAGNGSDDSSVTTTPPIPPPAPPPVPPTTPDTPAPNPTDVPPDQPPVPIARAACNRTRAIDYAANKRDVNGVIPQQL